MQVSTPSPSKVTLAPHDLSDPHSHNKTMSLTKQRGMNRSNSVRTKGIGLNLAVSPVGTRVVSNGSTKSVSPQPKSSIQPQQAASSSTSTHSSTLHPSHAESTHSTHHNHSTHTQGQQGGPHLKYDVSLPSTSEIIGLDFEAKLRLMALKEMSIVEIKDSMSTLQQQLTNHEKELHKIRQIIQKSLYTDLTEQTRQRQNSNPREEAIANTKGTTKGTNGGPSGGIEDKSSIWSNLSKPLNLIQQFDTMLQNEFEKSLITQVPARQQKTHKSRLSEDSTSSTSSVPSPLRSKSTKNDGINLDDLIQEEPQSEDMIHTVSNSIWSFMNEMKTNVLNSIQDEEDENSMDNTVINDQDFKMLDLGGKQKSD